MKLIRTLLTDSIYVDKIGSKVMTLKQFPVLSYRAMYILESWNYIVLNEFKLNDRHSKYSRDNELSFVSIWSFVSLIVRLSVYPFVNF